MAKPTGAICNLDCKYCFFLSKEALYPGSPFRMDDGVMEAYVRQIIESQQAPQVTIAWQGGEPTLMGLDFFQQMMVIVKKYARPGLTVNHTIQTNGTKLDDDWCRFFRKHNFLVGLSLDGPKEMHDAYRVDKRGEGTFDQVRDAARLLKKHNVEFNILCTVHAANAGHPLEVYHFFRDELGTNYIQFIPIIERATPELLPIANLGWGEYGRPDTAAPDTADADIVGADPRVRPDPPAPVSPDPLEIEIQPVAKSSKRPLYTTQGNLVTERSVTARRRPGLHPTIRFFPGLLGRPGRLAVHPPRDLRRCPGPGAQRRPLLLRPLRRAGLPAGQYQRRAHADHGRLRSAAQIRQ
jgi:pyruvate-formate lyase-activating enzyme